MKDFNYSSCFDKDIDIHDCKATCISFDSQTLIFSFDDGFWILNDNSFDDNKLHKSGRSVMSVSLIEDNCIKSIEIYIFQKKRRKTICRELSIDQLIAMVDSGHTEIEFLYMYKGTQSYSYIFECCLWSRKRSRTQKCIIRLYTSKITYGWNEVLQDKVW